MYSDDDDEAQARAIDAYHERRNEELYEEHMHQQEMERLFEANIFKEYLASADAEVPLIVQFGSEGCSFCPKATLDLDTAIKTYAFEWKYEDISSDLAEGLEVVALPALLVFHDTQRYTLYQRLRDNEVTSVIWEHCETRHG